MFHKLKNLLQAPVNHEQKLDISQISTSEETNNFFREAYRARLKLHNFFKPKDVNHQFISLGQNCSSAWYLKQLELKTESYPFDWIFSSQEIILDCIDDNFSKFLNKSLIEPKSDSNSAGHLYYHSNMFNHRNPLKSNEDYEYYRRCCDRFIKIINSQKNIIYLITLINEPNKRPGWTNGFNQNFKIPRNQDLSTEHSLINYLKNKNKNSRFIIIDHYTNQDRSIISEKINENEFFIKFCAEGGSTGVYYDNALDDFGYKLVISGLCNNA